jgi:hypothetical protein
MTETLHLKDCPVCRSVLSITHDKLEDSLTLKPENLPPLARDMTEVVTAYRRLKGLGAAWTKTHGARGMIYAGELLTAVGVHGGQLDRAISLLGWLKDSGKDFDLATAPTHYKAYQAHLEAVTVKTRGRCKVCGEGYSRGFTDLSDDCGRH